MSSSDIAVKRIRRQWEPEDKAWHDEALQLPWEEVSPPLHSTTLFALRNVFFFSHATAVQARTISVFCSSGNSTIVEAPTGSGKTLAVLIPLMERTVRACDAFVAAHNFPLLRRDIIGIVLAPSRVLAEQTFVVGRNLAARLPHTIRFALCDGAVQSADVVLKSLKAAARGAGTFLVTTPRDLVDFIAALNTKRPTEHPPVARSDAETSEGGRSVHNEPDEREELLAAQDEETLRRYYEKRGRRKDTSEKDTGHNVQLRGCHNERFVLVVDEADLVFHSVEMRGIVTEFVATHAYLQQPLDKRLKEERGESTSTSTNSSEKTLSMDLSFVGATVSTSTEVQTYAERACAALQSKLHKVVLNSNEDFVTQLQNRYLLCEAHDFLPILIQLMNLHSSKKHFIFFNSPRTLRFVEKLFSRLVESHQMLLCINHVFVMYEGMNERTRLDQYNAFLNHKAEVKAGATDGKKAALLSATEKKNQFYTSGWKREGRQPGGRGAILLCTDVAAFGLDVRDVDYVYHFEPPTTVQSYVHRIGRVGRMGMRGSSILILPCFSTDSSLTEAPERKSTSTRFNTLINTKSATSSIQTQQVSEADLSEERRQYLKELGERSELQPCSIPPFAPIAATVRNVISQHNKIKTLAQQAAMSMCTAPSSVEGVKSWFDPKLALHALLLN
ncbi:helicase, putative [Trypanosoma equiperdum]|uniref:ATP-dependent RNA helicase n=1 Tax=Trypanosoma equiperdum TaxID=5694 RepID=A0A1G4I1B2_TRYEQ|nr:helicase, putative [Trypanosoma equiperdum]